MKTIGFIDYYISEWHADNYPAWIEKASRELGIDVKVAYAWAEKDVSEVDGKTTDVWCAEKGITRCQTIEELCEKSDYLLVLAPSNPETHLKYAEIALSYKKPTYIDKTFAPNYETAKRIFDIAENYGTKFFSTSALRYGDEFNAYDGGCQTVTVLGSGASVEEYGIHQIEMLVKCMGIGAVELRGNHNGDQHVYNVKYQDGRTANLIFCSSYGTPAAFIPLKEGQKSRYVPVTSAFFEYLMKKILKFFETGEVPFDSNQTLEVMKIRDAVLKSLNENDVWIKI
ncbi:MAG: hypothetical protein IKA40_01565 [Clostridia bacterium]|nr:hypothetical protein [Clostridia bacterium]